MSIVNRLDFGVRMLGSLVGRDDGQDLVEYGLLAALIAVVVALAVSNLGNTLYTLFWSSIPGAIPGSN